ncbi:MAG: hypothetical protein A2902_03185 [Elusimicrobia bacterium RIFCSPLOWO2_01_FULL_64_13]|nr:MAG: hypothetical protein A2636_04490 [Elusimicrobia bacterium RIFCSPHIGHO2_01_FULL_64_10]OGR96227.1 MAG: hypothetical protein A2902_03185 [Elusimicrobia bacterium RIFCSPLOWO2_01_FULL_64_13]
MTRTRVRLAYLVCAGLLCRPAPVWAVEGDKKIVNELLDKAFEAYVDENFDRAIENFQKVLQIDPKDKTAQQGLKHAQKKVENERKLMAEREEKNLKKVKGFVRREKWLDAMDVLNEILGRAPNEFEALKIQKELRELFTRKMSVTPAPPGTRQAYQGLLLYMEKRYDEAADLWKESLTLRPDDFKLSIYAERADQLFRESRRYDVLVVGRTRARAASAAGNYEEAVSLWKSILDFDPSDEESRRELTRAEEMLERQNRKSRIGEHYDRGLSLFNEGRFAESLAEWQSIISIDPENEVALDYVEKIREKGVNVPPAPGAAPAPEQAAPPEPAVVEGPEAVKGPEPAVLPGAGQETPVPAPEPESDPNEEGIAAFNRGDIRSAVEFFLNRAERSPGDAAAGEWLAKVRDEQKRLASERYQSGTVAYSQGKMVEAIREWQKALEIDPNHVPAMRALNKVAEKKGAASDAP